MVRCTCIAQPRRAQNKGGLVSSDSVSLCRGAEDVNQHDHPGLSRSDSGALSLSIAVALVWDMVSAILAL